MPSLRSSLSSSVSSDRQNLPMNHRQPLVPLSSSLSSSSSSSSSSSTSSSSSSSSSLPPTTIVLVQSKPEHISSSFIIPSYNNEYESVRDIRVKKTNIVDINEISNVKLLLHVDEKIKEDRASNNDKQEEEENEKQQMKKSVDEDLFKSTITAFDILRLLII
jgi:hypothetical protein